MYEFKTKQHCKMVKYKIAACEIQDFFLKQMLGVELQNVYHSTTEAEDSLGRCLCLWYPIYIAHVEKHQNSGISNIKWYLI